MRKELKSHPVLAEAYALEEARDTIKGFDILRYGVHEIGQELPDEPVHTELTRAADTFLVADYDREARQLDPIVKNPNREHKIAEVADAFTHVIGVVSHKETTLMGRYTGFTVAVKQVERGLLAEEIGSLRQVLAGPHERKKAEIALEAENAKAVTAEMNRFLKVLGRMHAPDATSSYIIKRDVTAMTRSSQAAQPDKDDRLGIYDGASFSRAEKRLLRLVGTEHDFGERSKRVVFESELIDLVDPERANFDRPAVQAEIRLMSDSIMSKIGSRKLTELEGHGAATKVGLRRGKIHPINNQGHRIDHLPAKTVYCLVDAADIKKERLTIDGQMHECTWENTGGSSAAKNENDTQSREQQALDRRGQSIALAQFCLKTLEIKLEDIAGHEEDEAVIANIRDEQTKIAALDAHRAARDAFAEEIYDLMQAAGLDKIRQEIHDMKVPADENQYHQILAQRNAVMEHALRLGEYAPSIAERIVQKANELCDMHLPVDGSGQHLHNKAEEQLEQLKELEGRLSLDMPATWLSLKLKELARSAAPEVVSGTTLEEYNLQLEEKPTLDPADLINVMTTPAGAVLPRIGEYFAACQEYPITVKNLSQVVFGSLLNVAKKDRTRVANYLYPAVKSQHKQLVDLLMEKGVVLQRGSIIDDPATNSPMHTRTLRSFTVDAFDPQKHIGSRYVDGVLHNWEPIPNEQIEAVQNTKKRHDSQDAGDEQVSS